MSSRRSYGSHNDGCASAHALDLIGERWALIVVRELLLGPKRFAELQRDVVGISPTVLSRRLHDMETRGIAVRRTLPAPAKVDVYELTPWGSRLESVNAALSMWAVESPMLPRDADMSPDTVVLAMRAHARGDGACSGTVRVNLHLVDSRLAGFEPISYSASVTTKSTTIERESIPARADAEVFATTEDWKKCILGKVSYSDLPDVRVIGSQAAVDALIRATRL